MKVKLFGPALLLLNCGIALAYLPDAERGSAEYWLFIVTVVVLWIVGIEWLQERINKALDELRK